MENSAETKAWRATTTQYPEWTNNYHVSVNNSFDPLLNKQGVVSVEPSI